MRLIIASNNKNKIREIKEILGDKFEEIVSMREAGIELDVEEDADSFIGNARKKAEETAKLCPQDAVLADDSGLEVDYLNKEPGVHSSRYMGEDTSYDIKNQHIMDLLGGVDGEKRSARFVCTIAAVFPDGKEQVVRATIEGRIAKESKGSNGFGYDPIFFVPEFGCTTAELTLEQKNKISHRGKALEEMKEIIKKQI